MAKNTYHNRDEDMNKLKEGQVKKMTAQIKRAILGIEGYDNVILNLEEAKRSLGKALAWFSSTNPHLDEHSPQRVNFVKIADTIDIELRASVIRKNNLEAELSRIETELSKVY
jgi:hypothetical protein